MKWPYENELGTRETVQFDVLVLGGGISGCLAAISAKSKGLRVAIVEKGSIGKSVQNAVYNSVSTRNEYLNERYNKNEENLFNQFEKMGLKDGNSLKTKILSKNFKPTLVRQLRILGIKLYERVEVCNLIMNGNTICGAMGINTRTAKTMIFEAKAVISAMSKPSRIFNFDSKIPALSENVPFQCVGSGIAMGIRNGIKIEFKNKEEFGIQVDSNLMTSICGLFACGKQLIGCDDVFSCISGDYAGIQASEYALTNDFVEYDQTQIEEEEKRLFAPFFNEGNLSWIQLNETITECMKTSMELNEIEKEINQLSCKNPHDLVRIHEVLDILEIAKMIVQKMEESYE